MIGDCWSPPIEYHGIFEWNTNQGFDKVYFVIGYNNLLTYPMFGDDWDGTYTTGILAWDMNEPVEYDNIYIGLNNNKITYVTFGDNYAEYELHCGVFYWHPVEAFDFCYDTIGSLRHNNLLTYAFFGNDYWIDDPCSGVFAWYMNHELDYGYVDIGFCFGK